MKAIVVLLSLLAFAAPAAAQNEKDAEKKPSVQFIHFEPHEIEGNRVKPRVAYSAHVRRPKFERVLHIKPDFLRHLQSTGSDVALR